jgi:hypothetical protein
MPHERIEIPLTKEHITKGLRTSARFCPVALALKEAMPDCIDDSGDHGVSGSWTAMLVDGKKRIVQHRPQLAHWIGMYDGGAELKYLHPGTLVMVVREVGADLGFLGDDW